MVLRGASDGSAQLLLLRCRDLLRHPAGTTKSNVVAGHINESTESIVGRVGREGSELHLLAPPTLALGPKLLEGALDMCALGPSVALLLEVVAAVGAGDSTWLLMWKVSLLSACVSCKLSASSMHTSRTAPASGPRFGAAAFGAASAVGAPAAAAAAASSGKGTAAEAACEAFMSAICRIALL